MGKTGQISMQIGAYEVPEVRLHPTVLDDIKKVYDAVGSEEISSNDLAKTLGYAGNTSGNFYRKLTSLQTYGFLEGRGKFRVSELGKNISYPENENRKKQFIKEAVLTVKLWNEIYKKFGKNPPLENFWVQIKNITGIESPKAEKIEDQVRRWYLDDISQVSEDVLSETEGLKSQNSTDKDRKTVMQNPSIIEGIESLGSLIVPSMGRIEINDDDTLSIARSYLNALEKKILEKKNEQIKNSNEISPSTNSPEN